MSNSERAPKHTNRLAQETSPYLLQHAHNPVDWYPWGSEAFEKARQENKPIFLSVGYSACHWCHVMERESFEDEEVGTFLNERFVSIKVDREERPDVDDIYMKYVHLTRQQGGWPMSILMNTEGVPFYGGTYFPKPMFIDLMERIHQGWTSNRGAVDDLCRQVTQTLTEYADSRHQKTERPLGPDTITRAITLVEEYFDQVNGGMRGRMKFPPHQALEVLVRLVARGLDDERIRPLLTLTLDRMQLGGIHDHVGGGFHRYATDQVWLLPHFEKMLYDNAQLASYYSRAGVALNHDEYRRTARGILDWVLREMTTPEGAFYSAYDADSEGEEGKFYVWDRVEVEGVLGDASELFCEVFNIHSGGNFYDEATHQPTGLNIPHLTEPLEAHAKRIGIDEQDLRDQLDAARKKLLDVRVKRIWPGLDDKVLTSWNALMISAFARGGKLLGEQAYTDAAVRAAEWLLAHQRDGHGRWLATHNKGQSKLAAYLDDHAYLAAAFVDCYEVTGDERWIQEAEAVVEILNNHFLDERAGGFFFVADDHEKLLVRMKNPTDNAMPSGNGIAAQALVRLARITGKNEYREQAQSIFNAFDGLLDHMPFQVESMVYALDEFFVDGGILEPREVACEEAKIRNRVQKGPVVAELIHGKSVVAIGGVLPVALRITIDEGWHIQAHEPSRSELKGTSIKLVDAQMGSFIEQSYPPAQFLSIDAKLGLGEHLSVYGGQILCGAKVQIAANAEPGKRLLEILVRFQACSDRACEQPVDAVLSIPLEIAKTRDVAVEANRATFRELGWVL